MTGRVGLTGIALVLVATAASAADTNVELDFGAAASYVYDFESPEVRSNNRFSYANIENRSETFNIDLVQLELKAERSRARVGAKLDFGDLARFAGDAADGDVGLQEAYAAYDFGPVIARGGRCETPIGFETLEPWGNTQISRSRAWLLQPINHDGVTLAGAIGPIGVMAGVINSLFVADNLANDTNSDKGGLLQLSTSPGELDLSAIALYSEENFLGVDADHLILNGVASTQFGRSGFALEGNWVREDPKDGQTGDTWNVTGYAGTDYRRTRWDIRADYGSYDIPSSLTAGALGFSTFHIWSVTGTFAWILSRHMDVRLEYRHDQADNSRFFGSDDQQFSKRSTNVIQVQLVWYPEA